MSQVTRVRRCKVYVAGLTLLNSLVLITPKLIDAYHSLIKVSCG